MRELGGQYIYVKWSEKEVGFEIKGTYQGTRTDQFGKECPILVSEDGQRYSLNHSGSLEYKIGFAEKGDRLLVKYKGTEAIKTKYGVKDVHQFSVFNLDDSDVSPDDFEQAPTGGKAVKPAEESLGLDSLDGFDDVEDLLGAK